MTFKISVTRHGETQPFWTKIVPSRKDAERVVRKNQRLIDREKWDHTIKVEEVP